MYYINKINNIEIEKLFKSCSLLYLILRSLQSTKTKIFDL